MSQGRVFASGPFEGSEVKSALTEMLKKSFPDAASSEARDDLQDAGLSEAPSEQAHTPHKTPSKTRSLSDSTPKLSPSPRIKEYPRKAKDDQNLSPNDNPETPRRPSFLARGLSLQMPSRDMLGVAGPTNAIRAPPLSPRVDKKEIYASPGSVLPRHSRGLDFARACTNLHHSTLAESSPDSSPTITQKGMMIPSRKYSMNTMMVDAPTFGQWAQLPPSEKSVVSSSLGSVNMLGSDSSSSSDDDIDPLDPDDGEDIMINTPQVSKRHNPSAATPFAGTSNWAGPFSPGASNFQHFHRQRLRNRSRKSSSSASGHSSLASPVPQSPPPSKVNGESFFPRDVQMRGPASRRESLSMHTHDLHISSGNDSGDEAQRPLPGTPGVVRRAVTRRGNLLPKTRAFGRIRAELLEETMPVDIEVKREAEVIRQVRESDGPEVSQDSNLDHSSPTMQAIENLSDALQNIPEDSATPLEADDRQKGLFGVFARQSKSGNGGTNFWNSFENQHKTPPPPRAFPRLSSSTAMSDDTSMEPPNVTTPVNSTFPWVVPSREQSASANMDSSRASTPQAGISANSINPPTAADGIRKANKRRRDDDLDVASMKRRAVSPGVSVGNSPILSQSPSQRTDFWGQPLKPTQSSASTTSGTGQNVGERSNSNGSVAQTPLLGPKRVGLQGMNDMQGLAEKMSIE